ncbi:hypothetical protein ACLOJK_034623 [Asimina triloba]
MGNAGSIPKIGAVAGTALLVWAVLGREETDKKKMKQPGRGSFMYRDDFEKDPKGYFRGLHDEKKNNKK